MTALGTFIKYLNDLVEAPVDPRVEGTARYESGEFEAALPHLEAALADAPTDPHLHLMLGRIYLAGKDRVRARDHLEMAAVYEHDKGRVHYQLGELHKAEGDLAAAEAAFRKAIALNPKFTDAFIQLGLLKQEQQCPDEAAKAFEQAVYLDRAAVVARYYLAKICIARGESRRAQTQLHLIKQVKPNYGPIYTLMAEIAEQHGDFRQVIADLSQVVALGLGDAQAHYRMGVAHTKLKDFAGAIGCLQRAIAMGLTKWDAHCHLAQSHEALHQYDQAIGIYKQLMRVPGYQLFGKRGVDRVAPLLARIEAGMAA